MLKYLFSRYSSMYFLKFQHYCFFPGLNDFNSLLHTKDLKQAFPDLYVIFSELKQMAEKIFIISVFSHSQQFT